MRKLLMVAVLLVGVISGCASPKVVYNQVEKDEKDFDGKIRFQLTDTIIKFDYQKDSKDTGNPANTQPSVTPTAVNQQTSKGNGKSGKTPPPPNSAAGTGNPDKTQLSVTSTALNDTRATYTVEGAPWYANWFNSTDLTATHVDGNPLLLTQVGTSMTDQAIPVLKALGTAAASVAALVVGGEQPVKPAGPPTIPLPVGIKISELLTNI